MFKKLVLGISIALSAPSALSLELAERPESEKASQSVVERFGSSLFQGQFKEVAFDGIRDSYSVKVGDKIELNLWGVVNEQLILTVGVDGNVFIPEVGSLQVHGVSNKELSSVVKNFVMSVYKDSVVRVHASLLERNPIKVYVAGYVAKPGLYEGHSSDSVLRFIDQSGGIDGGSGSYRWIELRRGGQAKKSYDLYHYISKGMLDEVQFQDGDTVWVGPKKPGYLVDGDVIFSGDFEMHEPSIGLEQVINYVKPLPSATHVSIKETSDGVSSVSYVSLMTGDVSRKVTRGSELSFVSDVTPESISISVEGEHRSNKEIVVKYGMTLGDVLSVVKLSPSSAPDDVRLYRKSVQQRQKEMLMQSLHALESSALTARSATTDVAELRKIESEMLLNWVERAKSVEPQGLVVLANSEESKGTLLEEGDRIVIPRSTNLVSVHGEVLFPTSRVYSKGATVADFIEFSGGATTEEYKVLVQKLDGTFVRVPDGDFDDYEVAMGDELFVLPVVDNKDFQFTKEVTTIMYQIALAAAVVVGI